MIRILMVECRYFLCKSTCREMKGAVLNYSLEFQLASVYDKNYKSDWNPKL